MQKDNQSLPQCLLDVRAPPEKLYTSLNAFMTEMHAMSDIEGKSLRATLHLSILYYKACICNIGLLAERTRRPRTLPRSSVNFLREEEKERPSSSRALPAAPSVQATNRLIE